MYMTLVTSMWTIPAVSTKPPTPGLYNLDINLSCMLWKTYAHASNFRTSILHQRTAFVTTPFVLTMHGVPAWDGPESTIIHYHQRATSEMASKQGEIGTPHNARLPRRWTRASLGPWKALTRDTALEAVSVSLFLGYP